MSLSRGHVGRMGLCPSLSQFRGRSVWGGRGGGCVEYGGDAFIPACPSLSGIASSSQPESMLIFKNFQSQMHRLTFLQPMLQVSHSGLGGERVVPAMRERLESELREAEKRGIK